MPRKDREARLRYWREYRIKNREAISVKRKARQPINRTVHRAWVENNPEKVAVYVDRYAEKRIAYRKTLSGTLMAKAAAHVCNLVRQGRLPRVSGLLCIKCGAQAREYHHHVSYEPEHWGSVVPMCRSCHRITDAPPARKANRTGGVKPSVCRDPTASSVPPATDHPWR